MKKLYVSLLLTVLFTCLTIAANADDWGDWSYIIIDDGEHIALRAYTGSETNITVPAAINGIPIIAIWDSTFPSDIQYESITFPNGIIGVDNQGWQATTRLYAAMGSNTAKALPFFWLAGGDDNLKYRYEGEMHENLSVFAANKSLTEAVIPEGVTKVGGNGFEGCTQLASVQLPETLTTIEDFAFWNCSSLHSLDLPDGLKHILSGAFVGTGMKSVVLPDNMFVVHNSSDDFIYYANIGTSTARAVSWESGFFHVPGRDDIRLKYEGDGPAEALNDLAVYSNDPDMVFLDIPEGVDTIGSFEDCTKLQSIRFPQSLTTIRGPFYGCSSLKSVKLPVGLRKIEGGAFDGSGIHQIVLPDGVTSVGPSIGIDAWYANIGSDAAKAVSSNFRTYFRIPGRDDILLQYQGETMNELVVYPNDPNMVSIVIPEGVTRVEDFHQCPKLQSIHFPSTLTTIGYIAFYSCESLRIVEIPANVVNIGDDAFPKKNETLRVGCQTWARIWAERNGYPIVRESGEEGYGMCLEHGNIETETGMTLNCIHTELTGSIYCKDCGEVLDEEIIETLGHDWLPVSYDWSEDYVSVTAKRTCKRDANHMETETVQTTWTLTQSPTNEATGTRRYTTMAFKNPDFVVQTREAADVPALGDLTGLHLPNNLQRIQAEAFAGGNYEYIFVSEGCIEIGAKAFSCCKRLIYVRLPRSIETVADDAFEGCRENLIIDRLP